MQRVDILYLVRHRRLLGVREVEHLVGFIVTLNVEDEARGRTVEKIMYVN